MGGADLCFCIFRYGRDLYCQSRTFRAPTSPTRVIEAEDDLRDLYFIILGGIGFVAMMVVVSRWCVKKKPPAYSQEIPAGKTSATLF